MSHSPPNPPDGLPRVPDPGESPPAPAPGVADGLRLVERLTRLEVARLRALAPSGEPGEYRGLTISEAEVDRLLAGPPQGAPAARLAELEPGYARARLDLAVLAANAGGPLGTLVRLARLSPFEVGCLLLCLAPELDIRFERLFAYVQDDVTKRRPRVDLAVRLFLPPHDWIAARRAFSAEAPLCRWRLLSLHDELDRPPSPLPARALALDPRITEFLLGRDTRDEDLLPHSELISHATDPAPLPFPGEVVARLAALAGLPATALDVPVIHLTGRAGVGKGDAALTLARGAGLPLLAVDFPPLVARLGLDRAWTLAQRDAALLPAALFLGGLQRLGPEDSDRLSTRLDGSRLAPLTLLGSDGGLAWPGLTIPLPDPDFGARRALWSRALGDDAARVPDTALDGLAGKFRLGTTGIASALRAARGSARWRDPANPSLALDDLYAAARAQSTPILHGLAQKIVPHYSWDDIVLPPDTFRQLREMCAHVEHRHVVYERWGFGRKLAMGKGLMALFAGQSGTGKTMAAEVLAGTLGLDLYKIDLSGVVSKYIGETEKNLSRIFAEAETSNAILFFDEADALFGKRSEVKDSHDRYANIEIAFLLQKMEEYEGAVILATNLKMNLDEAFMRRMHFVVDFPMPEEDDRRRIWEATLPAELPLGPDVDLAFLARRFKLAGGSIRNVVLSAAFLAAADGRVVTMDHLMQATRRELQKVGRLISPSDFEGYAIAGERTERA